MRISARDREMAARICSARACWWGLPWGMQLEGWGDIPRSVVGSARWYRLAHRLADRARDASYGEPRDAWAEAEARIRTGWTP